jgi:hypothetical protein
MRFSRFTIDTHMKLFFAGATHAGRFRVREQILVTLKTLLVGNAKQNNNSQTPDW